MGQRTSFNRTRVARHLDEIQGPGNHAEWSPWEAVRHRSASRRPRERGANESTCFASGAVGFIDWLDGLLCITAGVREPSEWSGGPSDIGDKTTRVGASECGQRTSFNRTREAEPRRSRGCRDKHAGIFTQSGRGLNCHKRQLDFRPSSCANRAFPVFE